jgi:hypothetical protein
MGAEGHLGYGSHDNIGTTPNTTPMKLPVIGDENVCGV